MVNSHSIPAFGVAAVVSGLVYYVAISSGASSVGFNVSIAAAGALTAFSFLLLSLSSNLRDFRLLLALAAFLFLHFAMMQLEAWIFSLGAIDLQAALGLFIICLVFSAPFALASGIRPKTNPTISDLPTLYPPLLRLFLAALAFPVIYFLAGITILPFVETFYRGLIPPIAELMLWQLFRGLVFSLGALPLLLSFGASRFAACAVFAIVMPIVGGIAPLLLPNAAMPPDVRVVHGAEITASYVVYGALLAFCLYPVRNTGSASVG